MASETNLIYVVPTLNAASLCDAFCEAWRTSLATSAPEGVSITFQFIDGGSTDDTVARLERDFLAHIPNSALKIVEGCSIYQAWNIAIDEITASNLPGQDTWLAFIGLDDLPVDLPSLGFLPALSKDFNYVMFHQRGLTPQPDAVTLEKLRTEGMRFCHAGSLHRLDVFDDANRFSEHYRIVGDYEFFCRNAEIIHPVTKDATPLNILPGGISMSEKIIGETIAVRRSFKPPLSTFEIYRMAVRQFLAIKRQKIAASLRT